MKKFIVKSKEEELGEEFIKVTFPADLTREEANKVFEKAYAYVNLKTALDCGYEVNARDYDKHFREMREVAENTHGQGVFEYYLTEICGCKIENFKPDFEYEW